MKFENKMFKTEIVKDYIKRNGLTVANFCKKCKFSKATYYNVLNNNDVSISSLFKISRILKVRLCELFEPTKK